jgi:peptidyl-prolyl cis-trans isomerase C
MMRIAVLSLLAATLGATQAFGVQAQSISGANPPPAAVVAAAAADPSIELIRNSSVKVLQGDYDTELLRLPAESRSGFGTDINRINTLLGSLLVNRTLAAEARIAGLDRDPVIQRRISLEVDRVLALALQQQLEEQWAKEFDARPGMDQAARERWLAGQDRYRTPEQVQVTHILFEVPKRKREDAFRMAQEARAKVVAGADMNALAREISDDPSAQRNNGRLDWRMRNELDPQFARAAFALAKPGELSEPVNSRFGWHVIRLDAKRQGTVIPYDQVKAAILGEMRKAYVEQKRTERLASIRNDPSIVVNEPAVNALVKRIDPELLDKLHEDGAAAQAKRSAEGRDPVAR